MLVCRALNPRQGITKGSKLVDSDWPNFTQKTGTKGVLGKALFCDPPPWHK